MPLEVLKATSCQSFERRALAYIISINVTFCFDKVAVGARLVIGIHYSGVSRPVNARAHS